MSDIERILEAAVSVAYATGVDEFGLAGEYMAIYGIPWNHAYESMIRKIEYRIWRERR